MGGGRMGKNSYQTWASSSSIIFNGDVLMLECWCPIICAVRKSILSKNLRRAFYACPLSKVYLTMVMCCLMLCIFIVY